MKIAAPFAHRTHTRRALRGVVLVIALILLVVISLLGVVSMRNAGSSESVLGNVRTTELATQAAEIALRHCESSILKFYTNQNGDTTSPQATYQNEGFDLAKILPASTPPQWQNTDGKWDIVPTPAYVLPLKLVNQTGMVIVTYKRPPECMVEQMSVLLTNLPVLDAGGKVIGNDGTLLSTKTSFVITARGFGPEVAAADVNRSRPIGSEVWLQSHIQIQ